jgi:hypothetical protein
MVIRLNGGVVEGSVELVVVITVVHLIPVDISWLVVEIRVEVLGATVVVELGTVVDVLSNVVVSACVVTAEDEVDKSIMFVVVGTNVDVMLVV